MRYKDGKKAVIIDHVGNYARFGMPDDNRQWSLNKKPKQSVKKLEAEHAEKVRQCPECFFTFPTSAGNICPHCGYVFPKAERTVDIDTSAALIKVEGFKLDLSSPDECGSYQDLLEYAQKRGYKQGWAYYQARKRGLIA
jgi:superfamily II DNA or RNA helicase